MISDLQKLRLTTPDYRPTHPLVQRMTVGAFETSTATTVGDHASLVSVAAGDEPVPEDAHDLRRRSQQLIVFISARGMPTDAVKVRATTSRR